MWSLDGRVSVFARLKVETPRNPTIKEVILSYLWIEKSTNFYYDFDFKYGDKLNIILFSIDKKKSLQWVIKIFSNPPAGFGWVCEGESTS